MSDETQSRQAVAVIGAGPAGLFGARELAEAGHEVALINRDIKPGGLAEYGIFYNKYRMKNGLRRQFRQVMEMPNIHYFGNVAIGEQGDLSLDDLRKLGVQGVLVTVGAQGTKWLGLPGEELKGVYHAKDLVYHYNMLPPFSERNYEIGRRVALIGVGNVMLDIAHWTVRDLQVDEVIAVARRGPAEVKFTKKEWTYVAKNLDSEDFEREFERVRPAMEAVGQDIEKAKAFILDPIQGSQEPISETRFRFDFLASPSRILGDDRGRVKALEVEETALKLRENGDTKAARTGEKRLIDVDTVVFCIGDRVDERFGLPLDQWKEFAKNPQPHFPVDGVSYEAYDPEAGEWLKGVFLAGWAREASSGLVGTARKDGTNGAKALLRYVDTLPPQADAGQTIAELTHKLTGLGKPVVVKKDWEKLEEIELSKAQELNLEEFKFASNEEMLEAIGLVQKA